MIVLRYRSIKDFKTRRYIHVYMRYAILNSMEALNPSETTRSMEKERRHSFSLLEEKGTTRREGRLSHERVGAHCRGPRTSTIDD